MTRDLPDLPVSLLDRALIEGERLAYAADDLERQVLSVADRTRAGGAWTVTNEAAYALRMDEERRRHPRERKPLLPTHF